MQQNDDTLTGLYIGNWSLTSNEFNSNDGYDFSKLGSAIGENTHMKKLDVDLSDGIMLDVIIRDFMMVSNITNPSISCQFIVVGIISLVEWLEKY